jgi:hypothetical protein
MVVSVLVLCESYSVVFCKPLTVDGYPVCRDINNDSRILILRRCVQTRY